MLNLSDNDMRKQGIPAFKCHIEEIKHGNERLNTLLWRVQAYITLGQHNQAARYTRALVRYANKYYKGYKTNVKH